MSEEDDQGDLQPLTLRQKVENKRFNKTFDRLITVINALALGVLGYGVVKEALDAVAERSPFDTPLFLLSLVMGVGLELVVAYLTFRLTKRED